MKIRTLASPQGDYNTPGTRPFDQHLAAEERDKGTDTVHLDVCVLYCDMAISSSTKEVLNVLSLDLKVTCTCTCVGCSVV